MGVLRSGEGSVGGVRDFVVDGGSHQEQTESEFLFHLK